MTDTIEAGKVAASIIAMPGTLLSQAAYDKLTAGIETYAADRITAHTKALIEGAGELERRLLELTCDIIYDEEKTEKAMLDAAATIAAMKAEIERLTEREAQAKLDGVRAGIEASAMALETDARLCDCFARSEGDCACGAWSDYKTVPMERAVDVVRALSAEAIAKGITTAEALSDLIAGDADLYDGGK